MLRYRKHGGANQIRHFLIPPPTQTVCRIALAEDFIGGTTPILNALERIMDEGSFAN